ncbi:hypothetical protein GSI_06138 [Ganoderma sinense ZZ0214-1]|uniref:Uncharacterized protein n=1 Tax=Ganoderma sinense ZZ0214-1 TaxID=1077348 RepID=A0A2G8SCF2_9APHY|nr:hypothetical protein GSI_06138 [Ganoderma sinense ZZ0214-1]
MRSGSRLLSGASMETGSMLLEHTLLTSGEIAESSGVYASWPAHRVDQQTYLRSRTSSQILSAFHTDARYRKLMDVHLKLEDERRRLDKKLEFHEHELEEVKERLELMLRRTSAMRNSTFLGAQRLSLR